MAEQSATQDKLLSIAQQKQNMMMVNYGQLMQVTGDINDHVAKVEQTLNELVKSLESKALDDFTRKQIDKAIEKKVITYDSRIKDLEKSVQEMSIKIQESVLDKVGEMLTDNIYDIIPGYGDMEEKVHTFTTQFDETITEVQTVQQSIQEMQEQS